MKHLSIPDQTYKDLKRILPILAAACDTSSDIKVLNAARLAKKASKKLDKL